MISWPVKSKSSRGKSLEPVVDPEDVKREVADGLLIARAAATITVANGIIMKALRQGAPFDEKSAEQAVRTELTRLAGEQASESARMTDARKKALKSRGRSKHQHDYRRDDNDALALRETVYTEVAAQLTALGDDVRYLADIVAASRERAWGDVGDAIVSRIRNDTVVPDADYERDKEQRVRALLDVDFAALSASAPGPEDARPDHA